MPGRPTRRHRHDRETRTRRARQGHPGRSSPSPPAPPSLTTGKKATASNWFQKSDTYAPDKAVDGDPDTRWGCDWGTHSCWLEVDLGAPQTFDRAAWISEPYDRVQEFELQVLDRGEWKTFHRGTTIGENWLSSSLPSPASASA